MLYERVYRMSDFQESNRRGIMAARILFDEAQRLFIQGKYTECIEVFTEFIAKRGMPAIAFLSRGVAYFKTGQIDKAVEDFSAVIEMNNRNFRAYFYRGMTYMVKGDFTNSIIDFDKTIELKPDYGAAFFARGSAYAQIGDEYEAARDIKTAITFSESDIEGFTDTFGLFRTQFDKAMTIMTDMDKAPVMKLSEEEINTVKKWLEDKDQ